MPKNHMYKLLAACLALFALFNTQSVAQKKAKPNLYLYFKLDSLTQKYKTHIKSDEFDQKKGTTPARDFDVYHYMYRKDKKEYSLMLFSSINGNNYCVRDSSIFKLYKVLSYENLEKIKGLISETWDKKLFRFNKVFIIEKIAGNQFKTVQVQLYFPFNSEGVKIKQLN